MQPLGEQLLLWSGQLRVLTRAEGMHVWDQDGNRLLDGVCGQHFTTLGHGHPALVHAATSQLDTPSYCGQFVRAADAPMSELSDKLLKRLPSGMQRVRYTDSGAEANDLFQRSARHFWTLAGKPDKHIIIGCRSSDHGATPQRCHIVPPDWFGYDGFLTEYEFGLAAARELEHTLLELDPQRVAAFLAEPFHGNGGVIYPPYSYWPEVQRICTQYDILLCVDEVVSGFGRCGQWFGSDHFGIHPDAMILDRSLTSGYVPMGALVLSQRMADALTVGADSPAHGLRDQGHPLAAAVALANLRVLDDEGLMEEVEHDTGLYFQYCLRERFDGHPIVGQIQGSGMLAALQLSPAPWDKASFDEVGLAGHYCSLRARQHGLLVNASGDRIALAPALIASHARLDELIDKLGRAVDDTARALALL
ncbi:aminotransferase class III-fold pyridoxal phosphate-dependent enzyme [Herbaspirillum sp. alder98]|uniref:aminotransferase class III-fold pyridoxal phosphate-dependent enzyme n=1 Tax=Herbaspirillum sp. alder98 TaxID=2913096 RepID=UPI001CD8E504|nr:aminotransferase class III-fold pyridoxal phosphate-dependent enzyme [Herbaspirillum sp. alder98]MCA1324575.1 aminotransferase class III-fold pyridoxal phosphate-dependent enzyme [Herbaspirillum sp. alder98]